jgi:superfamily II RNA helicase
MVKVCSNNYPKLNELQFSNYFNNFSHSLHDFQKWSIEATVLGNHSLVCCPTASGKTLCGEFALDFFHSKGKKVIYTCPVKALSNQKFHDFTHKYPHISIGILTGDLKCNPDADVIICTTEILLNKLYQIKSNSLSFSNSLITFDMNIETELGCVVFDEIHMLNDASRGHVWEQCIMLLPKHVQIIGLSASLGNPDVFANWLENKGEINIENSNKCVYLILKKERSVPLIHNSFITVPQGIFKIIKDKTIQAEIKSMINKPFIIQDSTGKFNEEQYFKNTKMLKLFDSKNIKVKRSFVINQLLKHLVETNLLPALCFVFSRKQLDILASEINTNLLEFDSKIPYTIDYECEQIIRKMPNFNEYLQLPEYVKMVALLRKGIGCHHAGTLPVLREMTEILFSKGKIKLLLCTETLAIGINMPVKSCILTDVNKFDGSINRMLQSHEYQQISGRSGRLGIDTVGNCFHLNNLFKNVDSVSYKFMMNGKPQTLSSKFKISYNLLLNLLEMGDNNFIKFASRSMITGDLNNQTSQICDKILYLNNELKNIKTCVCSLRTPTYVLDNFINLQKNKLTSVNKKRKEIERQLQQIQDDYKFIDSDIITYQKITLKEKEIYDFECQLNDINLFIKSEVCSVLGLLKNEGFIDGNLEEETSINLTLKGKIASHLKETHCLIFTKLFEENKFDNLTSKQLISILSIFTNITVQEDLKENYPNSTDDIIQKNIINLTELYSDYKNKELKLNINTGFEYNINYDLLSYIEEWCDCDNVETCKNILQKMHFEKQIFLGEFVKALLKINNISCELSKIAELTENIGLLSKLNEIPNMTLKYIVTNQSLYV